MMKEFDLMEGKSSITALMSAFVRAYYVENEENPVFLDNIARKLFTDEEYEQMKKYIVSGAEFFIPRLNSKEHNFSEETLLDVIVKTRLAPTPIARARYCEDCLKTAILSGTKQYVILGAGYDTFAWRENELMKKLNVFEVDHKLTQADKKERIERANLKTPLNLCFVPTDFTKDSLKEKLLENGFDVTKKTFFSWLGVSYYLTDEQIRKMFSEISELSAEGSTIVFDYADKELFSSDIQRVKTMLAMANAGGEPMKFCCDSLYIAKLLEDYNFLVYEELNPDEIDFKYLNNSDITAFEHINYITAVIKDTGKINTKEKILQTALKLFSRFGYDAVSVRDISGQLGITQSALYKHYKNKQDIMDNIIKRMEENDLKQAQKYDMPETNEDTGATFENLKAFTMGMFRYWTEDPFASLFRKMITLEQYRNSDMSNLYNQYILGKPLEYVQGIMKELADEDPQQKALEFYSPMFMLMNMYDSADDKQEITELFRKHIDKFEI